MKKQSFVSGAFLLAAALGLGKIFSAIFKIPLDRFFLHADGMAIFNGAYNVYTVFFAVTNGIAMAISALIGSACSKEEENRVLSTALLSNMMFFSFFAVIIFVFSGLISDLIEIPLSHKSFMVMSPALIFCGITATLRGYFQGKMAMLPSAISQVSDSFGRLACGFLCAFLLSSYSLEVISAGAISGTVAGAAMSAVVLIIAFKKAHLKISFGFSRDILRSIVFTAIPVILTSSMHPIFNLCDTISVVPFLTYINHSAPQFAFGCLSRSAMLYALPVTIASAVASSVLPAAAESAKIGDTASLSADSSLALRLALLISIPCSAGFMGIPSGILNLLFDNSEHFETLVLIALSSVFLSASGVLTSILQGVGKIKYTPIAASVAISTKLILNFFFMSFLGINGAAVSTTASYLIFMVLLVVFLKKHTPVNFSFGLHIAKPTVCLLACTVSARLLSKFLPIPMVIFAVAVIYFVCVLLTGFIKLSELNQIFSAHKIEYDKPKNLS